MLVLLEILWKQFFRVYFPSSRDTKIWLPHPLLRYLQQSLKFYLLLLTNTQLLLLTFFRFYHALITVIPISIFRFKNVFQKESFQDLSPSPCNKNTYRDHKGNDTVVREFHYYTDCNTQPHLAPLSLHSAAGNISATAPGWPSRP